MAQMKECDCKSFNVGGIVNHQPDCASWEGINCDDCGSEIRQNEYAYNVRDGRGHHRVCEACHDNFY